MDVGGVQASEKSCGGIVEKIDERNCSNVMVE